MSDEIIIIVFMNTFAFFVQYISAKMYVPPRNYRDEQIDYLCEKICRLEKQVLYLEQEIEELYTETELNQSKLAQSKLTQSQLIQSQLTQSKLDLFGDLGSKKYSYYENDDVIDDSESKLEDYINYDEY